MEMYNMKTRKSLLALLTTAALSAAGAAHAGPPVTITFKHVGATGTPAAVYTIITANETSTYANASPKPDSSVSAGGSDSYQVQSLISPDANFANVRYKIGSKECVFTTTYVNMLGSGGVKIPTWNKTATPSGGQFVRRILPPPISRPMHGRLNSR